jgi:hypothetical protein
MKLVKEHINEFKQGEDPYKTMGIGSNRLFAVNDKIKYIGDHDPKRFQAVLFNIKKNDICIITDVDDSVGYDQHKYRIKNKDSMVSWISGFSLDKYFERI